MAVSVSAVETLIFRARRSLRLKASSVRSLVAVPLPTSLTQFFGGGGGVTVGGGAAVGTGVVLKAAVAIVAAALGTSIGGDNTRPATAAPRPTSGSVAVTASKGGVQESKAQQTGRLDVRGGAGAASKSSPANTAIGSAAGFASGGAVAGQLAAGQGAPRVSNTPPPTNSHGWPGDSGDDSSRRSGGLRRAGRGVSRIGTTGAGPCPRRPACRRPRLRPRHRSPFRKSSFRLSSLPPPPPLPLP